MSIKQLHHRDHWLREPSSERLKKHSENCTRCGHERDLFNAQNEFRRAYFRVRKFYQKYGDFVQCEINYSLQVFILCFYFCSRSLKQGRDMCVVCPVCECKSLENHCID